MEDETIEVGKGFLEKLMDCATEFLNSKKNEKEDDSAQDDDNIEVDGEEFSKKELVNAFKKMKENEAEHEAAESAKKEKEEEEKANSKEEPDFFALMQEKMNSAEKGADDKITVLAPNAGFEKGKKIFG